MALEINIGKSQEEMDNQFVEEFIDAYQSDTMDVFADNWGMTVDEAMDYAKKFYPLEEMMESESGESSSSFMKDVLLGALGIKDAGASEGTAKNGMFNNEPSTFGKFIMDLMPSVRMTKGNTEMQDTVDDTDVGVTVDPVEKYKKSVKEGERQFADFDEFGPKDEMTQAEVDAPTKKEFVDFDEFGRKDEMTQAEVDEEEASAMEEAGMIDGVDWNEFGLKDEDGTLEAEKDGKVKPKAKAMPEAPAIDRQLKGERDKDGSFKQPEGEVSPFGPGYHKRKWQNFWTVNEKDPFWQTEEGGLAAEKVLGSRPGWVKQKEAKEFDFDGLLVRLGFK